MRKKVVEMEGEGSLKRSPISTEEVSESYLQEVDNAILNAQRKKFKQTGNMVYAVAKGRTTGLFNAWTKYHWVKWRSPQELCERRGS